MLSEQSPRLAQGNVSLSIFTLNQESKFRFPNLFCSEKDLDEVLQIHQVFFNVSKGQVAPQEDLKAAFGAAADLDSIIQEILKKGELQVGGKERAAQASQLKTETLSLVASKCVNPATKRPYPVTIIEKAVAETGYNFVGNKPAKSQALEVIRLLVAQQVVPLVRARMKVRVAVASDKLASIKTYSTAIKAGLVEVEDEEWGATSWEVVGYIDPGAFRKMDEVVRTESKGKASMEVLETAAIQQGDEAF